MRIGTYMFTGLVFIALVAGGVYLLYPGYHSVTVMGITLNLPIAAWVALPLLLLYLLTILHMVYHGTRGYFRRRRIYRDAEELGDALYWSLLKEPKPHQYGTPIMKETASLLNASRLEVVGNVQGLGDKLARTVEWVRAIEEGEVIDLKEKKVEKLLSRENPLRVRNQLNRIAKEPDFAEEVLKDRERYTPEVGEAALESLVRHADCYKLKKYAPMLAKRHFFTLLDRVEAKEEIGCSPDMVRAFIEPLDLECVDYMRLARTMLRRITPDENLALFSDLAKKHECAQNAYLYLLFEYEMLEKAKQFLEEHDENEFKPFRAYFILKKGKYPFKIDDLIDPDVACHDS
ncbi:hypothetical protein [Nitratifractor sp.]